MKEMLIKYNEKYDRWCRSDGKIYRQTKDGKFVECKQFRNRDGYLRINCGGKQLCSHRLTWETLKGPIQSGYEIDHINTITDDNRLENLRCVTHTENMNNPLTRINRSKAFKEKNTWSKGKTISEFGEKFKEHFGITYSDNPSLYKIEHKWYKKHNKCRWEK